MGPDLKHNKKKDLPNRTSETANDHLLTITISRKQVSDYNLLRTQEENRTKRKSCTECVNIYVEQIKIGPHSYYETL